MLTTAFDPGEALRVTRISSPDDRADIQTLSRLLVEFDTQTMTAPNKPVHLVLAETSIEANATDRKDLAAVAKSLRAPRLVFALVSPSIVHRGALQAVTWLTPPPPGHHVSSFAKLESAASWIRLEVGVPLLQLEPLLRRVGYAGTP